MSFPPPQDPGPNNESVPPFAGQGTPNPQFPAPQGGQQPFPQQPGYGQPNGQPPYAQPGYGQPSGQPQFGQPTGQPQYGQPQYGQPQYAQPQYGQPQFAQPQPGGPVPLSMPLYGASFGQAMKRFFAKYVTFSGRASLSEYWWVVVGLFLINLIPQIMMSIGFSQLMAKVASGYEGWIYGSNWEDILSNEQAFADLIALASSNPLLSLGYAIAGLISLVVFIPSLAIIWRRLHDSNKSGAAFWLILIPIIGPLILLIMMFLPSNPAGARFDR